MSMSSDTAPPPAPVAPVAPLSRGKLVLLILAGVFAVLLGIVNAVLWNLSPQPVNTEDRKQARFDQHAEFSRVAGSSGDRGGDSPAAESFENQAAGTAGRSQRSTNPAAGKRPGRPPHRPQIT